ncbi:molybdopterin molybdotransferase MoeA [bacterium]|nr:molybdopterin molybdotransferase MoeA [bacterium]
MTELIELETALGIILRETPLIGMENVPLQNAVQRICAEEVVSDIDIPPFDTSAMDGYAVRHEDVTGTPVKLKVIESIQAGYMPKKSVCSGECSAIMTGAPLPEGADTVIMVEHTEKLSGSHILVNRSGAKSEHIRFKGEVLAGNSSILSRGTMVSNRHIPLLAAAGKTVLSVFALPHVTIISTGDELVEPHLTPKHGQIRNTNAPMLTAHLAALHIAPHYAGIAQDTEDGLMRKISLGLQSNILIVTGGVSAGDYDLAPSILRTLGVKQLFHKVNIQPGKPFFFGKRADTLIFGVPGNPVSSMIIFLLFIRPALLKMMGANDVFGTVLSGRLTKDFRKKQGRKMVYPVKISFADLSYAVTPLDYLGSADIRAFAEADGAMILDGNRPEWKRGEPVEFMFLC